MSNKYFGTDGIRGKYGEKLDDILAYKTGVALCGYFGVGKFVVGRDTRVSGEELESALVEGITSMGGDVYVVDILPTPAVARLAIHCGAKCGIMISASHNPPEYNGIKVFDGNGVKLTEDQEGSVEYYIDNPPVRKPGGGKKLVRTDSKEEYIQYLKGAMSADFRGLKVFLDCGYGAASTVAGLAFESLGATVTVENYKLRGEKINSGCGALYPYYVRNSMKGTDYRLGFSFDGDADRLSVVMDGEIVDGDTVLYNISRGMQDIKDGVVVGTILNNLGLETRLQQEGRRLVRTPVGDKFICDLMYRKGYNIGGEQSGHYIVYPQSTTGDGIMSAMFLADSLYKDGELRPMTPLQLLPQRAIAEFADPSIMYDREMRRLTEAAEARLSGHGRVIVRMSGTEPKVRVMVEAADATLVDELLAGFKRFINNRV
ncbi:MAG: phosphoglucosamine mutase [Clostridiales bacterium]|jgi:phosphoglucosamine mutase|nr:phosphoglucosamine mutase [Clostridiales bacterium]